jgi:hypothetical protein
MEQRLRRTFTRIVFLGMFLTATVARAQNPDAAQVAGDLKVDAIHFSSDNSVQSQACPWSYNGANIGYVQGNVGIGTLSPAVKLDVAGTVRATTIIGGNASMFSGTDVTVSGGHLNTSSADYATVSGGYSNQALGTFAAVSGGSSNSATGGYATVGGGSENSAANLNATVSGGLHNSVGGAYSVVSGGNGNSVSGSWSTISGGYYNGVDADSSWAGGTKATILSGHNGTFLWSDGKVTPFNSAAFNEFAVRATGGFRFVTAIDGSGNPSQTTVITSNGSVGIGNTAPISPLTVTAGNVTSGALWAGTANVNGFEVGGTGSDRYVSMKRDGVDNSVLHITKNDAGKLVSFFINGIERGKITFDGANTLYTSLSDARLKENIRPTAFGVDDLMKLAVKDYTFKADATGAVLTGFLAQDLYQVIPQAVTVGGDDPATKPWQVDYGKLTPFLVKAVQDLKIQNDVLKATNDAVKAENDAMKAENAAMKARLERLEKMLGL